MGTSQAARIPTTKKFNKVPSSLRSPARNPSTVVDAVVSAAIPMLPGGAVGAPVYYAAYEGMRFIYEVQQHGFEKAVERTAVRISEKYLAPSVAKGLWDVVASNVDPKLANSPYGRLAETAFKKTVSSIVAKGVAAMVEE